MSDAVPLLSVRHVTKHFRLRTPLFQPAVYKKAVDNVSFDVLRGQTLALVGESGSGKSTIGLMLLDLLEPTSGTILYDGRHFSARRGRERRALRREMQVNGLRVDGNPLPPVILTVQVDQRERVVVVQTAAGQVRELQLRVRFRFNLRTRDERMLIEDSEILLERDLSFNETQVLAKDAEEQMLYRDMTTDIAQQVIRRLASVRQL